MSAIYEPRGLAGEYARYAVNVWIGCSNGCSYCYGPSSLRMSEEKFSSPRLKADLLEDLDRDLETWVPTPGYPVMLQFAGDPFPKHVEGRDRHLALHVIRKLVGAGAEVAILSKNVWPVETLYDLDHRMVIVGTTLTSMNDNRSAVNEPHADSPGDRMKMLEAARGMGFRTWVSLEPVILAPTAMRIVDLYAPIVDHWKCGPLNIKPGMSANLLKAARTADLRRDALCMAGVFSNRGYSPAAKPGRYDRKTYYLKHAYHRALKGAAGTAVAA